MGGKKKKTESCWSGETDKGATRGGLELSSLLSSHYILKGLGQCIKKKKKRVLRPFRTTVKRAPRRLDGAFFPVCTAILLSPAT